MTNAKQMIKKILNYPLIDHIVVVINHTDKSFINLSGIIVEESKHMLKIDVGDHNKWVSKVNGEFLFRVEKDILIQGKLLLGYAKTRCKRKLRNW